MLRSRLYLESVLPPLRREAACQSSSLLLQQQLQMGEGGLSTSVVSLVKGLRTRLQAKNADHSRWQNVRRSNIRPILRWPTTAIRGRWAGIVRHIDEFVKPGLWLNEILERWVMGLAIVKLRWLASHGHYSRGSIAARREMLPASWSGIHGSTAERASNDNTKEGSWEQQNMQNSIIQKALGAASS